jgi:hypothetical protein
MVPDRSMSLSGEATAEMDIAVDNAHRWSLIGSAPSVTDYEAPSTQPAVTEYQDSSIEMTSRSPTVWAAPEENNFYESGDESESNPSTTAGRPMAGNPPPTSAFGVPPACIGNTSSVTYVEAIHLKGLPRNRLDLLSEPRIADWYDSYTRFPNLNVDFLDRVFPSFCPDLIIHDPIFDDPNVRGKFSNDTLSTGWFWHKETGNIVEGVVEVKPSVSKVFARAVAAGLFRVDHG